MKLKSIIDERLGQEGKTFKWLVQQVGISNDGLKAGIENETIKLKDFKKLIRVLNIPIQNVFEGVTVQNIKGDKNVQANHSIVSEPEVSYKLNTLEQQVVQLKSQLADKERIIELLSK